MNRGDFLGVKSCDAQSQADSLEQQVGGVFGESNGLPSKQTDDEHDRQSEANSGDERAVSDVDHSLSFAAPSSEDGGD